MAVHLRRNGPSRSRLLIAFALILAGGAGCSQAVDTAALKPPYTLVVYDNGQRVSERAVASHSPEENQITNWLESHKTGWSPSAVTYAPQRLIRGQDYELNFQQKLCILNYRPGGDGAWTQVTRPFKERDLPDVFGTRMTPTTSQSIVIDTSLLVACFRERLEHANHDVPLFLSIAALGNEPADPPAEVMAQLADMKLDLKPASSAELRNLDGIYDHATGKAGELVFVALKNRISDTKVQLVFGRWFGPLAGGDEEATFELTDGRWVRTEPGRIRMF